MRRIAIVLLAAVAFTGVSGTTAFADAPPPKKKVVLKAKPITKAPPKPAKPASSGFYVGINGGYDWGRTNISGFPFFDSSMKSRHGMAGVTFGYNAQAGAVVYGFETDIDAAWMSSTNWGGPPCFACEVQLRYFGTLRGRVGYAVGQALPYITGGLAYGGVKTSALLAGVSETDTKLGWTAGAGVEYALLGSWSVKGEYLYYELGKATCDTFTCGGPIEVKLKGNLVRTGFNYRF